MHLSYTFSRLALFVLALANMGISTPVVAPSANGTATGAADEPAPYIVSHEQMMHWIATTDAELTFIGKPLSLNPLVPRSAQDTVVVYCTNRIGDVCSSPCTVYNGGTTCLAAPDTNCLSATHDIGFCSKPGCTGDCTLLTGCILQLDDGFCWTPNTQSILVSTA